MTPPSSLASFFALSPAFWRRRRSDSRTASSRKDSGVSDALDAPHGLADGLLVAPGTIRPGHELTGDVHRVLALVHQGLSSAGT